MNRFVSFLPPVVVVASCAVTSPTDALDSAGFIAAFPGASHLQYEYVNGPTEQASEFATVYALRAEERLQRATAESRERDAAHALATRKLQLSPRIGDRAALGTIIDLRPPPRSGAVRRAIPDSVESTRGRMAAHRWVVRSVGWAVAFGPLPWTIGRLASGNW